MAGAFFMSFLGWVLSAAVARVVLSSSVALISTGISAGVPPGCSRKTCLCFGRVDRSRSCRSLLRCHFLRDEEPALHRDPIGILCLSLLRFCLDLLGLRAAVCRG